MALTIDEKIARIKQQARETSARINKKKQAQVNSKERNDKKIEDLEEQISELKTKNKSVGRKIKKIEKEWDEKKEVYEFKIWRLNKSK